MSRVEPIATLVLTLMFAAPAALANDGQDVSENAVDAQRMKSHIAEHLKQGQWESGIDARREEMERARERNRKDDCAEESAADGEEDGADSSE